MTPSDAKETTKSAATDPEANPWVTVSSRIVYKNPWISVREDQVIRPDGKPGIYGVVSFKTRAVGVIPIDEHGNTVLVGQYRYALGRYSWEIPEGGSPPDQTLEQTALRELAEETGLRATHLLRIGDFDLSNSVTNECGAVFVAWGLEQGETEPEGTEQFQYRTVPYRHALQMALSGEVTDGVSLIALMSLELQRQQGKLPTELARLLAPAAD